MLYHTLTKGCEGFALFFDLEGPAVLSAAPVLGLSSDPLLSVILVTPFEDPLPGTPSPWPQAWSRGWGNSSAPVPPPPGSLCSVLHPVTRHEAEVAMSSIVCRSLVVTVLALGVLIH